MTQRIVRPPVVVVLGHVDHGKTTLLDSIRKTNQTEKEVGHITQTIGAWEVNVSLKGYANSKITFIDTPGHEAFSKLRLRGAQVADIAVLVVDAKDSVMPQTLEAISHIKNAQIPFVVAINKIDIPQVNIDKVKQDLARQGVRIEGMGGEIPVVAISAKKGTGVDDLLETILIISSEQKLTFEPTNAAYGVIIESKKDKQGVVATTIPKDGCLQIGDIMYVGDEPTKIKALINDQGHHLQKVYPSTPCLILGFKKLPEVGTTITANPQARIPTASAHSTTVADDALLKTLSTKEENKKLKIIIKTNTQGALDVIRDSLEGNTNLEIVLAAVGEINKSDIFLAKVTKAILIGFAVTPDKPIIKLAEEEKVVIKTYELIYELLEELTEVSSLLKEKTTKEKQLKGEAKILAQFIIEKERVAGIRVTKGKLSLNEPIELYRSDQLIGRSKIVSLKTRAKPIETVKKNEEAGMIFYPQLDFVTGDVVKSYTI